MKNKTTGIAAATGLFGVAIGALVMTPAPAGAQQKPEGKGSCPQNSATDTALNAPRGNFRNASFEGPNGGPRGGRGGDREGRGPGGPEGRGPGGPEGRGPGGPEGRGPSGPEGRRPGPPPGDDENGYAHGPMLGEMIDQLDLSETQRDKVAKVMEFEREKMDALREQMMKIQTQTRTNLEAVLTAEQKQQLTKMESRMSGPNQGPDGERRGPRPGGRGERGGERGAERGERGGR